MAYATTAQLKTYLGITGTGDDALMDDLTRRAQAAIDVYTGRTFEAAKDETRYFTVGEDSRGRVLWLRGYDLAQITTVITEADASSPVTLTENTDYITQPRNETPYHALKMLGSSDYAWDYDDDPENGITVTGRWAYSVSPPQDIVHACIRLAGYYYRQKDSQVFDVTAVPEAGILTIPQGIPADVKVMLDPYRKIV